MKNLYLALLALAFLSYANGQSSSNNTTQNQNQTKYLGYSNNFSLLFKTNAVNRMKLNKGFNYSINGYNGSRSGNLLIARYNSSLYNDNTGAYSLLHIDGPGGFTPTAGFRPWMQAGITLTGNSDLSYMGLRQIGTQQDFTETLIAWTDNTVGEYGPDDMVFRFLGEGNGNTSISSNLNTINDLDGRHIARFAPSGEFGLGNTFGINPTGTPSNLYVRPQSLMHLSLDNQTEVWMQVTNQNGTQQTANDGLRLGVASGNKASGYLRWQENTPFIVQTDWDNGAGGINNGERMRVTSIGAINNTEGTNYGGLTTPTNRTRIAISADGSNPITKPLSLLHLGYNTGQIAITPGTDGWRSWMDLGVFTTNGSDNVYLGLKEEVGFLGDRQDAVLSWGDNQTTSGPLGNGPDNFRMIFTSTTASSGGGTPPATSVNGLEGMRLTPTPQEGVYTGIGGDPTANQYGPAGNSENPTATLEVNSWGATNTPGGSSGLRFTNLNITTPEIVNPGKGVLGVNANGDVIYVEQGASSGGGIGNICGATQNPLTDNYEIPLNTNIFRFTDPAIPLEAFENSVVIGKDCNALTPAKLNVYRDLGVNNPFEVYGAQIVNSDLGFSAPFQAYGTGLNVISDATNRVSYGIKARANNGGSNIAGNFSSNTIFNGSSGFANIGLETSAGLGDVNYGLKALAVGGTVNFGVQTHASNTTGTNYGIYASASSQGGSATSFAGFFAGDVVRTGTDNFSSDSILKKNVQTLNSVSQIINQLNPVNFDFKVNDYPQMNLANGLQYGFIAQEVEQILPELVMQTIFPPSYDSLGNIVNQQIDYKSVNYQSFIPILTQGFKEQQVLIDSLGQKLSEKDSLINDLDARLAHLENCLSGLLPILCQLNQQAVQSNTPEEQSRIETQLSVILSNKESIILDQNVPNPFAEKTVIDFSIPESVQSAQLHFYNNMGRLIKTVDLVERGNGSLTVYGSDLSSGVYTYTLIADGKSVATKKMVKR